MVDTSKFDHIIITDAKNAAEILREAESQGAHLIAVSEPSACAECGESKELRPYGKDGAWVCFDCAMEDEENAKAMFGKTIDG